MDLRDVYRIVAMVALEAEYARVQKLFFEAIGASSPDHYAWAQRHERELEATWFERGGDWNTFYFIVRQFWSRHPREVVL